jgi:hypothetical protein
MGLLYLLPSLNMALSEVNAAVYEIQTRGFWITAIGKAANASVPAITNNIYTAASCQLK